MPTKLTAFFLKHWFWISLVIVTLIISSTLLYVVFAPAYQDPKSRTYTSKLGFAEVKRSLNQPFEVKTSKASMRSLEQRVLGEGLISSETVLVPIIPITRIKEVLVNEGDVVKKGQTLAILDEDKINLRVRANEIALESAKAELERVKAGTAYILSQERQEEEAIELESALGNLELLRVKKQNLEKLAESGAISGFKLLEIQSEFIKAQEAVNKSQFKLQSAQAGSEQSLIIAQNAVEEASLALSERKAELKDHAILAPADGVISRRLIHPGEFNQDTGRPAFVLSSGLWFEAHFDQTSINHIQESDKATVYLEAYPGQPLEATISSIIPIVTYNLGGPETNRPIRPRGTGAPEWPATFRARITVHAKSGMGLVPGLTGFARILNQKLVLSIPKKAVISMSASHGMVHVIEDDERSLRKITTGISDNEYIEVRSGLKPGETIITEGHTVLEPEDKIEVENSQ